MFLSASVRTASCLSCPPSLFLSCQNAPLWKEVNACWCRYRRCHPHKSRNKRKCLGKWDQTSKHRLLPLVMNVCVKLNLLFPPLQSQLDIPFKVKAGHIGEFRFCFFFATLCTCHLFPLRAGEMFLTLCLRCKGRLELKIPWKNLYTQSVEATLDGVFLLIVPTASKTTTLVENVGISYLILGCLSSACPCNHNFGFERQQNISFNIKSSVVNRSGALYLCI